MGGYLGGGEEDTFWYSWVTAVLFTGSGTIKRIGMPSGSSGNTGKMITNFIYRPIILLLQIVRNTLRLRRLRDKFFFYTIEDFSLVFHFERRGREPRSPEGSHVPPVGEFYDISEWRACMVASYPGAHIRLKGVQTQDIIILQLWNHLLSFVAGDDKEKMSLKLWREMVNVLAF